MEGPSFLEKIMDAKPKTSSIKHSEQEHRVIVEEESNQTTQ